MDAILYFGAYLFMSWLVAGAPRRFTPRPLTLAVCVGLMILVGALVKDPARIDPTGAFFGGLVFGAVLLVGCWFLVFAINGFSLTRLHQTVWRAPDAPKVDQPPSA